MCNLRYNFKYFFIWSFNWNKFLIWNIGQNLIYKVLFNLNFHLIRSKTTNDFELTMPISLCGHLSAFELSCIWLILWMLHRVKLLAGCSFTLDSTVITSNLLNPRHLNSSQQQVTKTPCAKRTHFICWLEWI